MPGRQISVSVNGISLSVWIEGDGPTVVLCHGFPELGYSWRHQIPALVESGYRVAVPDMRGYGHSSQPTEVEAYDVLTIAADLIDLLDWLEADSAVFVGHDWGAVIAWSLARVHPERVRAVAGLSVPPTRRAPAPPVSILRRDFGDDFYIVWFQETGPADEALARDVRRTITSREAPGPKWAAAAHGEARQPSWMTSEELEHYVRSFERTGFSGGLNYYRNIDRNWQLTASYGDQIDRPAMFLTGERDPVNRFMPAEKLEEIVTDLRANVVVAGAGHWVQQERPEEVSQALVAFLDGLP
jgi:pimeloyl-ACP methyl ester carboxylesterase